MEDLCEEIRSRESFPDDVRDYATRLLDRVREHGTEIDTILTASLTRWDLKRLATTDRSVLRMSVAELLYEPDVPTSVVLDEAIIIARQFGAVESGRFVNGVLDRVARDHRQEKTT